MQTRYVRPGARALAIQRESFDNWLYFAARAKGAFRPIGLRRDERHRWKPTTLSRFFGKPDVLYFD
ncbi:MAG: hypothetical protein ABI740_07065 [Alphaproteobacteria bacterium]